MRTRLIALAATVAVGSSLLASPAYAAHTVSIDFPGTVDEFYSPFKGPATITVTIDPADVDDTFKVKIRRPGGAAIHVEDFFVDAQDPAGTKEVTFDWPALTVSEPKQYEVLVVRDGATVGTPQSFFLYPKLVEITGINPNPFLPWIDDGYKDVAHVHFTLENDADVEARVFEPKSGGGCCGALIRDEILNGLSAGTNTWDWDGQGEGAYAGNRPKGDYFVRIWADDGIRSPALSAPKKVSIARTYRALDTMQKNGINYHHTGSVTVYERGGNCFVSELEDPYYDLYIICTNAKFKVYWRWNLPDGGRIEKVSFVKLDTSAPCGGMKGHTTVDSYLAVGGSGQWRCRIDKAKITFSVPAAS